MSIIIKLAKLIIFNEIDFKAKVAKEGEKIYPTRKVLILFYKAMYDSPSLQKVDDILGLFYSS